MASTDGSVDPAAIVLTSHNGQMRVTLLGDIATIATLDGENWQDWRSGEFKQSTDGGLEITYKSKKKGGTVVYCIMPDEHGNFDENALSYEE